MSGMGGRTTSRRSEVGLIIAVVGAESTGKTTLAHQLAQALASQGHDAVVVHETLRTFCEAHGRTPSVDEQAGIALAHSERIAQAASLHAVVIADTTALMTAVYSDFIFDDHSLYPLAMAHHQQAAVTLLTALDLPWVPDGHQRDGPHVQRPVDERVRRALIDAGLGFTVVGGQGEARLAQALAVVCHALGAPARAAMQGQGSGPSWRWVCDDCDDPEAHAAGLISRLR
jgi:nicotinamide riboside kinase